MPEGKHRADRWADGMIRMLWWEVTHSWVSALALAFFLFSLIAFLLAVTAQ